MSPEPHVTESLPGPWMKKTWGRCRTLFRDCHVEIVEAEIVAGGYSSNHKHLDKDNAFHVIEGELEIQLYPATLKPQKFVLLPKVHPVEMSVLTIPPHVPHKFTALQATRLIEIYRACHGVPLRAGDGDIVRFSEGGVRK
jgi:mannose-6-phosphate isomerase-like protein (cupin superfamily)